MMVVVSMVRKRKRKMTLRNLPLRLKVNLR